MSIWNTYSKDYPMPEGFEDPLNGGTDLCPSYFGFNEHMQIWFQDAETHKEIFGEEEFIHPFHIDVSYCQIEDCECVGRMIMDMHGYKRLDLKTWDEVLTEIDNYKTQLNTEKFNQERYENFRENFLASSNGIEMPEGFINSAWQNDVFPSIAHESGRIHIFFADIDGWISDFGQPPEDWKKYMFQSHPTKEVYAESNALADDPQYVEFQTNDWNEILEKIEEWRATQ